MKNRTWIALAAFGTIALLAIGCPKVQFTTTTDTTTTAATSPADTTAPTATGANETMGTNPAATSGATNPTGTSLNESDRKDAIKFAGGELGEIAVGDLAVSRAASPDVKSFAQKLVSDHTNASNELKQVASAKNLTLPTGTDAAHQKYIDELKQLSGKAFDRKFVQDMVKDHDQDIKDFEKASRSIKDSDLKAWVEKTLPVIREHDKLAHDLEKK